MVRRLCTLIVALAASAVVAQEDPLQSPECRKALEALQTQEAAGVGSQTEGRERRTVHAALEKARQHAATACLRSRADAPPPAQRFAQPPIAVAPVRVAPTPPPQLPTAPAPPLPKKAAPPTFVTICDAGGCWASDGSHLQRVGPNLLGPRGLCSVQGARLHCPR